MRRRRDAQPIAFGAIHGRYSRSPAAVETILTELEAAPEEAPFGRAMDDVDRLFAGDGPSAILQALDVDGGEWALAQAATLRRMSPQALAITHRQLALGAKAGSFAEEMAREYDLAGNVVLRPAIREGVRALLVDKENSPRWSPATLDEVTPAMVDALFAPRPGDSWTPLDAEPGAQGS